MALYSTSNLRVVAGDSEAIVVDVEGVVIDLNGFSLTGPVSCPGTPPSWGAGGPAGVTGTARGTVVRNGVSSGMSMAISLGGTGARVEDLSIWDCNQAIVAYEVGGHFVARNVIVDSNVGGFIAAGVVRDNTLRNVNIGLSLDPYGGYVNNVVVDAPSASVGVFGGPLRGPRRDIWHTRTSSENAARMPYPPLSSAGWMPRDQNNRGCLYRCEFEF